MLSHYLLFIVKCYLVLIGALAGVKDSDAVVEAVMQGDVDTAKRLLRVTESGKQIFMLGDFGRHSMYNWLQYSRCSNLHCIAKSGRLKEYFS